MPCYLAVILTDGTVDKVQESECGSMSYCGAKDLYPDTREMGYPFDRPFARPILDTLNAPELACMAVRPVTIHWVG
jgi:hypothetical protein